MLGGAHQHAACWEGRLKDLRGGGWRGARAGGLGALLAGPWACRAGPFEVGWVHCRERR